MRRASPLLALALLVTIALAGCAHRPVRYPRAMAAAGGVLLTGAVAALATMPICGTPPPPAEGEAVPGLGAGLDEAFCTIGQGVHVMLAILAAIPGVALTSVGLSSLPDRAPAPPAPRPRYQPGAPGAPLVLRLTAAGP